MSKNTKRLKKVIHRPKTTFNKASIVSSTITIRMSKGDVIISSKHVDEIWNRIVCIEKIYE